jgi:hypothetical protein
MTPVFALARYLWIILSVVLVDLSYSSGASAFTEIPVRPNKDGAGPSHIFHLHDRVLAVVDPLDGKIAAYKDGHDKSIKESRLPNGSRPWRLVRQPDKVIIISEGEKSRIEVPRDENTWPQQFVATDNDKADPRFRMPRVKRMRSGLTLLADGKLRALSVKAIGPNYLASLRELDRVGNGRRYLLWKEQYFADDENDPSVKKIQVDVYVGEFDKNGKLSGLARIDRASMNRIGFDYVTILPNRTFALLASMKAKEGEENPDYRFKIYSGKFERPSKLIASLQQPHYVQHYGNVRAGHYRKSRPNYLRARYAFPPPPSSLSESIAPGDTKVIDTGGDDVKQPVSDAPVFMAKAPPPRADYAAAMDAYRDETWTLIDKNLRNPCDGVIVEGIHVSCPRKSRFVSPFREFRQPYPNPMKGLPYDWGGADSIAEFKTRLERGYAAGNIGGTFWTPQEAPHATTGIDCSGLVSNVWKLGRHIPTSKLNDFTIPVAELNKMRVGDALLLAGVHVVLYREQVMPDGASLYLRVTEATSRCGAVCDSIYEIDYFQDYTLRRRKPL